MRKYQISKGNEYVEQNFDNKKLELVLSTHNQQNFNYNNILKEFFKVTEEDINVMSPTKLGIYCLKLMVCIIRSTGKIMLEPSLIYVNRIPHNIEKIKFDLPYSKTYDFLSELSIKKITLVKPRNKNIYKILSNNLSYLKITGSWLDDEQNYLNCNEVIFPKNLQILKILDNFNHEIKKDVIPPNLLELYFGRRYNKKIGVGILPASLKKLVFGSHYNLEIDKDVLPEGLEYIEFGTAFTQEFKTNVLPKTLKYLSLPGGYNNYNVVENTFPKNLIQLIFDWPKHNYLTVYETLPNLKILGFNFLFFSEILNSIMSKNVDTIYVGPHIQYCNFDFLQKSPNNINTLIFYELCKDIEIPISITKVKLIKKKYKLLGLHNKMIFCKNHLKKIPFGCIIVDKNDNLITI